MCCHSSNTRIRPLTQRPGLPSLRRINNARELRKAHPGSKKHVRKGVWNCYGCREQFNVAVGTVFDDSHILLNR